MAEAVSADYELKLVVEHTVPLSYTGVSDPVLTYTLGDHRGTLDASSTVTATKAWEGTVTLIAGIGSLNLTALDSGDAPDVDFTDLKVVLYKISCPSTNTSGVLVDVGAISPYNLFGDATGQLVVLPGGVHMAYLADQAQTCDATHKALALTSTDLDASISFVLVAGG